MDTIYCVAAGCANGFGVFSNFSAELFRELCLKFLPVAGAELHSRPKDQCACVVRGAPDSLYVNFMAVVECPLHFPALASVMIYSETLYKAVCDSDYIQRFAICQEVILKK